MGLKQRRRRAGRVLQSRAPGEGRGGQMREAFKLCLVELVWESSRQKVGRRGQKGQEARDVSLFHGKITLWWRSRVKSRLDSNLQNRETRMKRVVFNHDAV